MKQKLFYGLTVFLICVNMLTIQVLAESPLLFSNTRFNPVEKATNRSCHDTYEGLVNAMMKLKTDNQLTSKEISKIHTYYQGLISNNTVPSNNKDLLNALYKEKLLTDNQYNLILNMLK